MLQIETTIRSPEDHQFTDGPEKQARGQEQGDYSQALDLVHAIVWRLDAATLQITFVSEAAEAILGYPRADWFKPREVWADRLPPEDRAWLLGFAVKDTLDKDDYNFEHRIIRADGQTIWLRNVVHVVREHGQAKELVGVSFEVTELKQTQESLRQALAEVERLKSKLHEENVYLRQRVRLERGHNRMVGQSQCIRQVLAQAEQVAATDSTVLLLGETGTGKELLAASIHEQSARGGHTLVSVNCAAMPSPLMESEMFGRERGAFTGSLSRQVGRFELAQDSTIFLDEVSELSLEVQSKLLRVVETRQIERLGNPRPVSINVRIIAASNRDLAKAVGEGKFRQDLYYRLNVFPITVPPLRERREDIPLLVWSFVNEFVRAFNKNVESIERESMDALQSYSWPGNVRELRNVIERAMIIATGPKLRIQLPTVASLSTTRTSEKLQEVERDHLLSVLASAGWRVRGANGAAERLGLKATTLEARMAKLSIHRPSHAPVQAFGN